MLALCDSGSPTPLTGFVVHVLLHIPGEFHRQKIKPGILAYQVEAIEKLGRKIARPVSVVERTPSCWIEDTGGESGIARSKPAESWMLERRLIKPALRFNGPLLYGAEQHSDPPCSFCQNCEPFNDRKRRHVARQTSPASGCERSVANWAVQKNSSL